MNIKRILNKRAVIKKPRLIEKILSSLIVVLMVSTLAILIAMPSIQEYISASYWDGVRDISDYLWKIKQYAEDGITDEEMEQIRLGANRQAMYGRPVIVKINGEEVVNLTNKYAFVVFDEEYNGSLVANDWYPEASDAFEEIWDYEAKSVDFYFNGYAPVIKSAYYNPVTKELMLDEVDLYHFYSTSFTETQKVIKSYKLLAPEAIIPEGFLEVHDIYTLNIIGDIKSPMSDYYEGDDLTIEIIYENQLLANSITYRTTCVIVAFALAIIVVTLISGVISYYKSKSIYSAFEYRRKTTNAMAHDLKTPLAIVSLSVANLKDSINGDGSRIKYHADEIDDSVTYINSLINNILEFSKSEDDNYKISKTVIDVKAEIEKYISEITSVITSSNLKINVKGEMSVTTDAKLWNQAINNLIDNALKYAAPDSAIEILLDKNRISISNIVVTDIKDVDELTEPFVKGSNSRGENSGSGLGLSIADNNLKRLGYKLSVNYKDKVFEVVVK